ncbi:MAG: 30S ribosomal protein S11 [Candidatus Pacearchaeota archaeon]
MSEEKQKTEKKVKEIPKKPVKETEVKKETAPKEDTSETENKKDKDKKTKERKKAEAVLNIYTSFNNTIVHVTDMSGKTLTKVTGGMVTKHGRLKANPTIAMYIAKRVSENLKDIGVGSLYFRIRTKTGNPAPGPGANAIVKSLSREGFKILNILDTTRYPRGGPKKGGGRRGRRP